MMKGSVLQRQCATLITNRYKSSLGITCLCELADFGHPCFSFCSNSKDQLILMSIFIFGIVPFHLVTDIVSNKHNIIVLKVYMKYCYF